MSQESQRKASATLVDGKYQGGFTVRISEGFVIYQYMLPNAKDGKNLLFDIRFNDGYFKDLNATTELFLQFFQQKLNVNNDIEQIKKLFLQYVNANYAQMFVQNTNIVNRVENFHVPSAPVKQNFQQATKTLEQKIDDKPQSQHVDVDIAVFGVPHGFDMDTNIKSSNERNRLNEKLQTFYNNGNDGLKFVVLKDFNKNLYYNFLVYPKGLQRFSDAYNRGGSFFGLSIIVKDACFTDTQQVYKVLSEFYYNHVVGKYITQYPDGLKYNNGRFDETDIVKEFDKYLTDCGQNGKLQAKSANVSMQVGANKSAKIKLENGTKELTEEFLKRPDLYVLTMIPENTNPLERPNNIAPQIIRQNTYE